MKTVKTATATDTAVTSNIVTCPKCAGTGFLGQFIHVSRGVCFTCSGTGKLELKNYPTDEPLKTYTLTTEEGDKVWFEEYSDGIVSNYCGFISDKLTKEEARVQWKRFIGKGFVLRTTSDWLKPKGQRVTEH